MPAVSQTTLSKAFCWMIKISLKFVPKGPINNNPALVQIMAWHWSGDKPLSEPMMVSLLTHICVTRPQWVKGLSYTIIPINQYKTIHRVYWIICPFANKVDICYWAYWKKIYVVSTIEFVLHQWWYHKPSINQQYCCATISFRIM